MAREWLCPLKHDPEQLSLLESRVGAMLRQMQLSGVLMYQDESVLVKRWNRSVGGLQWSDVPTQRTIRGSNHPATIPNSKHDFLHDCSTERPTSTGGVFTHSSFEIDP